MVDAYRRPDHPVHLATTKNAPELPTDNLIRLVWKSSEKKGRTAHASRNVSIPIWQPNLGGKDSDYLVLLVEKVAELQKLAAHAWVTAELDSGNTVHFIPGEIVDPRNVLEAWLTDQESENKGMISAAQVETWYLTRLQDIVMTRIAAKNGFLREGYVPTDNENKRLAQTSRNYLSVLSRLAAPMPKIDSNMAEALLSAINLIPKSDLDSDYMAGRLLSKLSRLAKPKEEKIQLDAL